MRSLIVATTLIAASLPAVADEAELVRFHQYDGNSVVSFAPSALKASSNPWVSLDCSGFMASMSGDLDVDGFASCALQYGENETVYFWLVNNAYFVLETATQTTGNVHVMVDPNYGFGALVADAPTNLLRSQGAAAANYTAPQAVNVICGATWDECFGF